MDGPYRRAADLVRPLLDADPEVVRRMRDVEPVVSKIHAELIMSFCPAVDADLAIALCKRFAEDA
jgi:hypothetical protein